MPLTTTDRPATGRVGPVLATLLMLLTVFGPISMDLYLPVLPALTDDLGAATSAAQFTLTACLVGLAVGQLIAGPLSDRFGRRVPLLAGITAYVAASALCAVSPSIETLVVARLVQGLAGAVGIVIAQAAGRDVYEGGALIRFYGRLTVIGGLAAIVGPVIGGQLANITDWRGLFGFLAVVGAVLLVAAAALFGETLPAEQRVSGGLGQTRRDFRTLLSDRLFVGAVLICGLTHAALFAYLSGATYILQGTYGLSPQGYSITFGANSLGFMVFGWLGGRAAERWSERGTLVIGIVLSAGASLGLLATGLFDLALPFVLVSLFVLASGTAMAAPSTTSLALADYPELAGTASSVLGMARFGFGGIAAPLVGLGGAEAVLPLGIVTMTSVLLAAVAYVALVRRLPAVSVRGAGGAGPIGLLAPRRWKARLSSVATGTALVVGLTACEGTVPEPGAGDGQPSPERVAPSGTESPARTESPERNTEATVVTFTAGSVVVEAVIEDTPTGRSFVAMLPMTLTFSDFGGAEKVASPQAAFDYSGASGMTPAAGDLFSYRPWGNLGFFYDAGSATYSESLVRIGTTDDLDEIERLDGQRVTIAVAD